eukprot:610406-Prymnesium_polylepis.1
MLALEAAAGCGGALEAAASTGGHVIHGHLARDHGHRMAAEGCGPPLPPGAVEEAVLDGCGGRGVRSASASSPFGDGHP